MRYRLAVLVMCLVGAFSSESAWANRYYSPEMGRFITRWRQYDSAMSLYQYQFSGPTYYTDPYGDPLKLEAKEEEAPGGKLWVTYITWTPPEKDNPCGGCSVIGFLQIINNQPGSGTGRGRQDKWLVDRLDYANPSGPDFKDAIPPRHWCFQVVTSGGGADIEIGKGAEEGRKWRFKAGAVKSKDYLGQGAEAITLRDPATEKFEAITCVACCDPASPEYGKLYQCIKYSHPGKPGVPGGAAEVSPEDKGVKEPLDEARKQWNERVKEKEASSNTFPGF